MNKLAKMSLNRAEKISPRQPDDPLCSSADKNNAIKVSAWSKEIFYNRSPALNKVPTEIVPQKRKTSNVDPCSDVTLQPQIKRTKSSGITLSQNTNTKEKNPVPCSSSSPKEGYILSDITRNISINASRSTKVVPIFSEEAVIGRGSFGKVFRARLMNDTRICAIKQIEIPPSTSNAVNPLEKIVNEIVVLQANAINKNPFTLNLIGYWFSNKDVINIAMEYASGGDLLSLVLKLEFTEELAKYYTAQIALGIGYLHDELGVIHRDLKPANIMIDAQGKAKIGDFGFATRNKACQKRIGTIRYMSPERLRGKAASFASDWWCLGMIHYFMLFKSSPFRFCHSTKKEEIAAILYEPPLLLHPGSERLSTRGEKFLMRILDKNPLKRLGARGSDQILELTYFKSISINELRSNTLNPPFPCNTKPRASSQLNKSNATS